MDNKFAPHEKPLAAAGLNSYRYRGPVGFAMIGAKDSADAMREAARSVSGTVLPENLEVWNGSEYVPAHPDPEETEADESCSVGQCP